MTTTQQQAANAVSNTILVYEEAGTAKHRFCTKAQATEHLDRAAAEGSAGSMFTVSEMEAELVYKVSPNVRERVDEAKRKLRIDIAVRDALNRQGVPSDRDLRIKIKKAIDELGVTVLRPVG